MATSRSFIPSRCADDLDELDAYLPLPDGIYNLFTIENGKVTRIDDFAAREKALTAAGLAAA